VNIVTELLEDTGFITSFVAREEPFTLAQALQTLNVEPTDPQTWATELRPDFEPVGPELLQQSSLPRFPAYVLPTAEDEQPESDYEHGDTLWLAARYLDPDRREIVVFPEDDEPVGRLMMYAPQETEEQSVLLHVISAELSIADTGRRLSGLFLRHSSCPQGWYQPDQTFYCPPGRCPKGSCTCITTQESSGIKRYCRCRH
jgi:hypothetical protein